MKMGTAWNMPSPTCRAGMTWAMKIRGKNAVHRYKRDNTTSYLLVSEESTGARHITTKLFEIEPGGKQHIHSHITEQYYFILEEISGIVVGNGIVFWPLKSRSSKITD